MHHAIMFYVHDEHASLDDYQYEYYKTLHSMANTVQRYWNQRTGAALNYHGYHITNSYDIACTNFTPQRIRPLASSQQSSCVLHYMLHIDGLQPSKETETIAPSNPCTDLHSKALGLEGGVFVRDSFFRTMSKRTVGKGTKINTALCSKTSDTANLHKQLGKEFSHTRIQILSGCQACFILYEETKGVRDFV